MSADELVDIIDEQNKVLYSTAKSRAHADGLLHRTVLAAVFDSAGRWLLVRQAGHKQDAGQLVSAIGGHVQAGESAEDALRRETLEEIGVRDFSFRQIAQLFFDREILGHRENHFFTVFEIFTDEPLVLNEEATEYVPFTEAKLKRELRVNPQKFGPTFHISVDTYYPHLRR